MFLTGGGASHVHSYRLTLLFILQLLKHIIGVMITPVLLDHVDLSVNPSVALRDLDFTHSTVILEPRRINLIKMLSSLIHL